MQNSHFQNQINVVIDGVEFDQAIFTSPETRNEAHAILENAFEIDSYLECYCLCDPNNPRPINAIRKPEIARSFLRLLQFDSHNHQENCGLRLKHENIELYQDVPRIKNTGDYVELLCDLKLQVDLEIKPFIPNSISPDTTSKRNDWVIPNTRKSGLGGIFNYLISVVNLNVWAHGEIRTYIDFASRLLDASKNVFINKISLMDRIYICGSNINDHSRQQNLFHPSISIFLSNLENRSIDGKTRAKGILFDEVIGVTETQDGTVLECMYLGSIIKLDKAFANKLKRSCMNEWAALGKDGSHVIGIFCVSMRDNGKLHIEEAKLCLMNSHFIPSDSFYEVIMANHLINNDRSFLKPLRNWNNTGYMPDYVLLDTYLECVVEVWGLNSPEYLSRRNTKTIFYKNKEYILIQWEPSLQNIDEIVFPSKRVDY